MDAAYKVGDRLEFTLAGTLTDITDFGDVLQLDTGAAVDIATPGMTIKVVHHPKPEAGTVINGRQLKHTWWKRGTVITALSSQHSPFATYVLTADGTWVYLDDRNLPIEFNHFSDTLPVRVDHLP